MLPIAEFLPQISQSLSTSNNLVLQAEPGAGKSTALPLSLLDAPWLGGKKILMLEPRRVATRSIAHYLARQSGEPLGKRIGYQVKNDRKITRTTQLEIVTEGILTRRIQQDPELADVGLIIFDEFHERSIHSDLALMLCLDIQQTLREDLKLLVMSATIDTRQIADYMGGATVISCPGRAYPVSVSYTNPSRQPLEQQITDSLRKVLANKTSGDTLVFLPGQAEIRRSMTATKEAFGDQPDVVFLPLYGALSIAQQEQALVPDPDGKRRIVFTTNIAETSLTIEGVTCVIDSGLEKLLRYDPSSGMTRLETTTISRASADQRQGRAGRTQAGHCIRLWDEARQRTLKEYQSEEIITAELTSLVLELISWGISHYDQVNWLTPAPKPHFDTAIATLQSLKLIDQDCRITALGRAAADFGLHPGLAAMLLQAENPTAQAIACELAALISERDIFSPNHGTDIVDRLWALQAYKQDKTRALNQYPMRRATVEQLLTNARSLSKRLKANNAATTFSLTELQEHVGRLLLSAYPSRLAKRRTNRCGRYQMANGKGVFLFEDDPLFGSDWLVIADCDGQKKEGRIYSAAGITRADMEEQLKDQFVEEEVFSFDTNTQKISGKQLTKYQAITLHSAVIANIPPAKFQQCLQQVIKEQGFDLLNWNDQCQQWLARAEWLAEQLDSFPKLSKQILIDRIDDWLLPYIANVTTMAALKKVPLLELVKNALSWQDQQLLEQQAPTQYTTPSNQTVPIVYDKQQGPTVSVILQELFGVTESPMLAQGRVALRFELLSPARRPFQTTSDLGSFWKSSYFEVAKEMRGRYPKHRWPDKPLLEKPGKSFKKR
ncbi:MAG: ATP-dependent helicase HrpB [Immundisolibacteraceae bacterium]|nr:ATP-dependent helicase HrpB [Immundisolibacteraceae bacterium]